MVVLFFCIICACGYPSHVSPRLHVSMVPDVLPCRGTQFTDVCSFVESKLANGESGYVTPLSLLLID